MRTCTKTFIAICFRKTSVYSNGLSIRVCNSRKIVSVSLCLMPIIKATNSSFQKGMTFFHTVMVTGHMYEESYEATCIHEGLDGV